MDNEDKEYEKILISLDKRAKATRYVTLTFVSIMFISMTLVLAGVVSMKSNSDNPVSRFVTSILDQDKIQSAKMIDYKINKLYEQLKLPIGSPIPDDEKKITRKPLEAGDFIFFKKDTSEKIADSVTSIIISLSILLFIGYVMRVAIVFIKYHMQLGTDCDNQKIAFLLSKGKPDEFRNILETLRNQKIGFEKTPQLPQEKIIMGLIEAVGVAKGNTKNDG